jgi:hypothetical protein
MLEYIRRTPAAAFGRFAAILCGIALTWTCAAVGLVFYNAYNGSHGCRLGGGKIWPAIHRVRTVESALERYWLDHDRCPATKDDLVANGYLSARDLVDPWGRSIAYWCSEDDSSVTSAGPDGAFGTEDDIKYPE